METRDILYSDSLNCPRLLLPKDSKSAEVEQIDSESIDQLEQLNFVKPEQMQAYKDMREVVLPGETRTHLIEFLLEKYEPGIMHDCHDSPELALK